MHKELAIALGAGDRRVDPAEHFVSSVDQRRRHLVTHSLMDRRIADHAAAPIDLGPSGLELWLDEQDQLPRWAAYGDQRRQHANEGYERQVGNDEVDLSPNGVRRDVADVEPLEHAYPRVG